MTNREIATVENCIAEARRMQESGQYINGTIFHLLADEVERLRAALENARRDIFSISPKATSRSPLRVAAEAAAKRIEDALNQQSGKVT